MIVTPEWDLSGAAGAALSQYGSTQQRWGTGTAQVAERLKTFYGAATHMSFAVYVFIG